MSSVNPAPRTLGNCSKGQGGVITRLSGPNPELLRRLMEMGFIEGARVEVLHEAPFGGDPIAVSVRGSLIALRRAEAHWVEVSS